MSEEETRGDPADVSAQTVQQPQSPTQAVYAKDDVYAPDGKKWKDKFHGAQGYVKQKEASFLATEGSLQAQIENLQQMVSERDATASSLQDQITSLTETSSTIPALREQITQLKLEAAKASKYQIAMRYPSLLSLQVEEEVPVPDGQEGEITKRITNPVLDLIESSGLDTVTLETTLQNMVKAVQTTSQPTTATTSIVSPAAPAPAEPAGNDKSSWIAKAKEAQQRLNSGDTTAWADFEEASKMIRELEVQEASRK